MRSIRPPVLALVACYLAACGEQAEQQTSAQPRAAANIEARSKRQIELDAVPEEVLRVARSARPSLSIKFAEHEVREGRHYYDLIGTESGADVEVDIEQVDGHWRVVEVQRDIQAQAAPPPVNEAVREARPDLQVRRIIQFDRGGGLVIYKFLGTGADGHDSKVEVSYDGETAHVLARKRAH